jgi:UDP-3-O-[3-hydroxymyristoyl] glucosamine N-acyltransferase
MISIDPSARISPLADLEDSVRGTRLIIGAGVVIDAFVKIKPAGGVGDVTIGAGSVINSGCVIYSGNGVVIGQDVAIAANCTFAPTNHGFADASRDFCPAVAALWLRMMCGLAPTACCWTAPFCAVVA